MYTIPMDPSWDFWVQQKTSKKLLWLVKNDLLPWKLTNVPWTSPVGSDVFPTEISGDSWMYPYQRTPMGNPYISPIYPYWNRFFFRGRMTNVVFGGVNKFHHHQLHLDLGTFLGRWTRFYPMWWPLRPCVPRLRFLWMFLLTKKMLKLEQCFFVVVVFFWRKKIVWSWSIVDDVELEGVILFPDGLLPGSWK